MLRDQQSSVASLSRHKKSRSCLHHSIKIKIPKHEKLINFFSNFNQQDPVVVSPKDREILHSQRRINKSVSLKSIACSSLTKKIQQNSVSSSTFGKKNEQVQLNSKDQSRTRSGLTVADQYGLAPTVEKNQQNRLLCPKTPKQIKSISGSKKIIFPIKAEQKNEENRKDRSKKKVNCFQYTFGVQGVGLNLNLNLQPNSNSIN